MKKLISAIASLTLAACLLAACGSSASSAASESASSEAVSSEVVSSEAASSEAVSGAESSEAAAGVISEEEAAVGFVTTVNGITADYNADGAWWCLTDAAGEMTTVGVADIELHDGDSYAFTYTK